MDFRQTSVYDLVEKSLIGRINIPIFQRQFEWKHENVMLLLDSLLRGYPIGSLLLWEAEYHFPQTTTQSYSTSWLIDGQQRVTSLCILFDKKPYWWEGNRKLWSQLVKQNNVLVNIRRDTPSLQKKKPQNDSNAWVSIQQIFSLDSEKVIRDFVDMIATKTVSDDKRDFANSTQEKNGGVSEAYDTYEENESEEDDSYDIAYFYDRYQNRHDLARRIESRIRRIISFKNTLIPQIVTSKPPSDMARIFTRLNRGGLKLSATSVFLAVLSSAHPKWVKNDFGPFCEEMAKKSGINLDPSVYVKALTGYMMKTVNMDKLIGEKSKRSVSSRKLHESWSEVKPAIVTVLRGLWEHGIQSEKIIPSKSTLVPLFLMKSVHPSSFNMDKALNWFMAANFHGYKSDYFLDQHLKIIHESKHFLAARDKLLDEEETGFEWDFSKDEFDRKRRAVRIYKMILYLVLYNRGAKDWFVRTRIGYDYSSGDWGKGYKPHWHHIFPKAKIRSKSGVAILNSLSNLTVINEKTNIKIRDSRPFDYLQGISKTQLKSHLIPLDDDLWYIRRFPQFVNERAKMIARAVNGFIKKLG